MKSCLICASVALFALTGCGLGDLFGSGSEELRMRALVRDELGRAEAERGPRRRQYIDERITETVAAADTSADGLAEVQTQLGQLQTDLSIVARKVEKRIELGGSAQQPRPQSAPAVPAVSGEQLASLRSDIDAALRAVSKLNADSEAADARNSARFERLELRTKRLDWPDQQGARGLHLASYRSHEAALAGWEIFRTEFPDLFANQDPLLVEVPTVAGAFVRLMVGIEKGEDWLRIARDRIRDAGEYAMIMPVPRRLAPDTNGRTKIEVPTVPKLLVPGS